MALTRLEISAQSAYRDGEEFADVGAYRITEGVAHFAVEANAPLNSSVVDLGLAAETDGRVCFRTSFRVLAPADATRGNGCVLQDVPNRGRHLSLGAFNRVDRAAALRDPLDPGDGFLLRRGYTMATCGWQHGITPDQGFWAELPTGFRGEGEVVCQIRCDGPRRTLPIGQLGTAIYRPADLDDPRARLIVRQWEDGPDHVVPRDAWSFARETDAGVEPSGAHIHCPEGFEPGAVYLLVYPASDPPVMGVGMLALRDFGAHMKADSDVLLGFGASQTGRLLRHLVFSGLNVSAAGDRVFDGLLVHIAGGQRGDFNHRFAQPTVLGAPSFGQQFPFAAATLTDGLTGETDGLFAHLDDRHVPKVAFTNTSWEYWRGDASLLHIDGVAERDVDEHPSSRCYAFAGTQHINGGLPQITGHPLLGFATAHGWNVVDFSPLTRAALANLEAWTARGEAPPPSRHPRLDDGSAKSRAEVLARFADAGAELLDPERLSVVRTIDPATRPVTEGEVYPAFVADIDAELNERAGIRLPDVSVPVGFHTGWNPRAAADGAPEQAAIFAGTTKFFDAEDIAHRYGERAEYLAAVETAARQLVRERYLLDEDVAVVIANCAERFDHAVEIGAAVEPDAAS